MPGAEVVANRPIGNFDLAASENAMLVPITDRFQIDHYHNTAHPKDPFYEQRWQDLQKAVASWSRRRTIRWRFATSAEMSIRTMIR